MKRFLLELVLGSDTTNELVMCLEGAVWCMEHDVASDTKRFELKHINDMIDMLKERR